MNLPDHKTKIVCTIGPASESQEVMEQMLRAGMNVARLNFSHGDFAAHKKVIDNLRAAAGGHGTQARHHGGPLRPEDAHRQAEGGADRAEPG